MKTMDQIMPFLSHVSSSSVSKSQGTERDSTMFYTANRNIAHACN